VAKGATVETTLAVPLALKTRADSGVRWTLSLSPSLSLSLSLSL
jgi:hypothetical protein